MVKHMERNPKAGGARQKTQTKEERYIWGALRLPVWPGYRVPLEDQPDRGWRWSLAMAYPGPREPNTF